MNKRFISVLLVFLLAFGTAVMTSGRVYAEPASAAGVDQSVSAGQFVSGFVGEDNVLYMTGLAADIPWHQEGNAVNGSGSPVWTTPVKVMNDVRSVSFAHETYAVIRTDGSLWMWGDNTNGLVGNGGSYEKLISNYYKFQYTPVKVMENVAAISLSEFYCAAIKKDGSLWAWGRAYYVQNHVPASQSDSDAINRPVKILDGVKAASCGATECCIVKKDGSLWVWNTGKYDYSNTPQKVMDHVRAVSCSLNSRAILKDDGTLWMYGRNVHGELGYGSLQSSSYTNLGPYQVLEHVVQFTTGSYKAAAVTEDGSLYVWGDRGMCGLGDGSMVAGSGTGPVKEDACILTPKKIMDGVAFVDLARNQPRGFAVKKDGTVWGWGSNRDGELGNSGEGDAWGEVSGSINTGTFPLQSLPVQILSGIRTASFFGQSVAPTSEVIDPNPSAWAKDIVAKAIEQGLVPENLQGNYTKPITRAEFCALAATLYESRNGEITERSTFSDTKDVNVEKLASLGVVAGVGNGKFVPDRQITREQAATMLAALAGVLGKPIEESEPKFADNSDISSWAIPYVGKMQTSGIMNGTGNDRFSPQGSYTREQSIATMLSVLAYVEE